MPYSAVLSIPSLKTADWIRVADLVLFAVFTVLAVLTVTRSGWHRRSKPSAEVEEQLQELRGELEAAELSSIRQALRTTASDEFGEQRTYDYFVKKLFSAIDYAIKRHDWFEDQRARIFQASMTLMTGVLAIIAIVSRADTQFDVVQKTSLTLLGLVTLVSVVTMVVLYNLELNADRPYRKISNVRFWFFRYNLPDKGPQITSGSEIVRVAQSVAEERRRFMGRVTEDLRLIPSIREDLEQLFILQTLQRYKSDSLSAMRRILSWFIVFGAVQLVLLGLMFQFPLATP